MGSCFHLFIHEPDTASSSWGMKVRTVYSCLTAAEDRERSKCIGDVITSLKIGNKSFQLHTCSYFAHLHGSVYQATHR